MYECIVCVRTNYYSHVLLILSFSGCGVHIRTGTSCAETTTIGNIYYQGPVVLPNVWTNERYEYTTASEVTARAGFYDGVFQGLLEIGATAIEGLVFVGKVVDRRKNEPVLVVYALFACV
jgi:hypothetical protein